MSDNRDFDITLSCEPSRSARAQQLSASFEVPLSEKQTQHWEGALPLSECDWNIGLIVGSSGSGKTTLLREVFGEPLQHEWAGAAVVDDFDPELSLDDLVSACQAVGFNTIPAWLRPYDLLSNGEQFRVGLARALADATPEEPVLLDEFTSVVDRQVAKIAAAAVAKHVRRRGLQLVAATCHYDVIDWLQPDWTLEPAPVAFTWRSLQPRPTLDCEITREPRESWGRFAPFHYLTQSLHKAARCFVLWVDGRPASFAGIMHRPSSTNRDIKAVSRVVTLPDWQGLGLAFALLDRVAAAYVALGYTFHMYPAHPALIRAFDRSPVWLLRQKPLSYSPRAGGKWKGSPSWEQGQRWNAVFRYVGEAMEDEEVAAALTGAELSLSRRKRMRTSASVRG